MKLSVTCCLIVSAELTVCPVVEDKVDSCKLLKNLKQTASQEALSDVALEAVKVSGLSQIQFILVVGFDLIKLVHNGRMVRWQTTQLSKSTESFVVSSRFD